MLREAQIPLALWLPAALLAHALTGGGAHESAKLISERNDIIAFAREARMDVRRSLEETSIEILGEYEESQQEVEPTKDDQSDDGKASDEQEDEKPELVKPKLPEPEPEKKKPDPPKLAEKKLEPKPEPPKPLLPLKPLAPKKEAEKKQEQPKPPEVAKAEPKKEEPKKEAPKKEKKNEPQRIELPKPEGRIAVINDPSLDKDQQDNPNASRIADHANTVKEETMARFRSYDQNASKPTGGGNPEEADPSAENPGNSTEDKRGHSIENQDEGDPRPGSEKGPDNPSEQAIARSPSGSNDPQVGQDARAAQKGLKGREAGKGAVMPGSVNSPSGGWTISPDGGDGRAKQKGRKGRKAIAGRGYIPGIPKAGILPQKYSITAYGLMEALGKQHLRKEQEKARNTRLARHRGKFTGNSFQKYRAAIENYDPAVKPGNQTSLNAARVPFASYINMMHNRIHPIFADGFLGSLSNLGSEDKLNNMKLISHVEMVLDGETGKVVQAGIVKPSGVTAFDVGALSSLHAAGPFGQAPEMIVSPDGKVYVHWEFYRDPYYACTSKFARPYLINPTKKDEPSGPTPTPPPREDREAKREEKKPLRPER